jgi:hypothetical protein
MFPHLQRDNSDSGSGTVTGVIDNAAGSKEAYSTDSQTPPANTRVTHCATLVHGAAKVTVPEKPCNAGGLDTSCRDERESFMWMETRGGKFASVGDGGAYWSTSMTSGLIPAAVRDTAVMLFRTICGDVTLVVMRDEIGGMVTGKGS